MKIIRIIILSLLLVNVLQAQLDEWVKIGDMPSPVADAAIVFYQTGMYVLGGYSETTQSSVNFIQRYSSSDNTWQNSERVMLSPRRAFVSVAYSGALFSAGGAGSDSQFANSLEILDFFNPSLVSGNPHSNFDRKSCSGVLYSGKLYLIGGNPDQIILGHNYPYITNYDLSNNVMSTIENQVFANRRLPEQQMVEIFQDEIYIFGGVLNGVSQDIYKYDISDQTLIKLDIKLLEPRAAGQAVILGDESMIFIMGGYNENVNAMKSVEVFSFQNNEYRIWSAPEMKTARSHFMSSFSLNKFYVMGGFDEMGNVISSIESFEPSTTSIEKNGSIPKEFVLSQNYPNPFNPTTNISFRLKQHSQATLNVYSLNGEYVCTLVDSELSAGSYSVQWNGKDSHGKDVASGVYIYNMNSENSTVSQKMILLR